MKLKLLLFTFLFLSIIASAQNNKGKFFVETGVKISGGGDYFNFGGKTGINFDKTTDYWKSLNSDEVKSFSITGWSFSIAPRIGVFLSEKINGGVDFQYYNSKMKSRYFDAYINAYRITTGGIFLRYYFSDKKISPFLEAKTGIGISKGQTDETSSGGGSFNRTEYQNLFYYAFNVGASFKLNNSFRLNLSAMVQNTTEKFSDKSNYSTDAFKISDWELVPMLSVTYIFKSKKEK
jgi:outer membrane protein W